MPAPDGPQFNNPQESAFANRNQATYSAARDMARVELSDIEFTVHPTSPEEAENMAESEFRIRMFHQGNYQAGGDYFTDDWDEVQAMISDPSSLWGSGGTGRVMLPDPDTDFARMEQADYDQHLEDIGEFDQFWDENPERPVAHDPDWSGGGQGPDYNYPDPFDRSDPEQARQAKAIEDMNKVWE